MPAYGATCTLFSCDAATISLTRSPAGDEDRDAPWEDVDVGDGVLALPWPGEVFTVRQTGVEDRVETLGLVKVALDGVRAARSVSKLPKQHCELPHIFSGAARVKWFAWPCIGPTPPC